MRMAVSIPHHKGYPCHLPPQHGVLQVPRDQGWLYSLSDIQVISSTRLHQSLAPNARFRFINVAEWATVEHFQAALNHPEFAKLREATSFPHFPARKGVLPSHRNA